MGCFLGCFGGPRNRRRSKPIKSIPSRDQRSVANLTYFSVPQPPEPEHHGLLPENSLPKPQQEIGGSSSHSPSRLQFPTEAGERPDWHLETRDESEKLVAAPKQLPEEKPLAPTPESGHVCEKPRSNTPRKRVTFDLNVRTHEREPEGDSSGGVTEEEDPGDKDESKGVVERSASRSSSEAFPSNHRYQNCVFSDGENSEDDEDDELGDDYDDDSEEDRVPIDGERAIGFGEEDEYFESYFSAPNEEAPQTDSDPGGEQPTACGHGARDRSRYVHPVLNPVENLSQWKEAKLAKTLPIEPKLSNKENICMGRRNNEALVNASLSHWLP